ncbi:MAG: Nramp family divalent metal transporter [Spirochaetes bacterium]|nr:Nramp family divalent metal transporter [Spirochaetota bacterium]
MFLIKKIKENAYLRNIIIFFSVMGPGIITGSVDNDAGGITTYSVAGAEYGYHLIWTLIPSFIVLIAVQEMNARMGIVTGKGLADLIRENFGVKITFYIFACLLIANIGNTATEFAGIAGSLMVFNVSKYISVPVSAIVVWIIVVKWDYKKTEKIFLLFSFCLLSYIISAVLARPDWSEIGQAIVSPEIQYNEEYLTLVLGIVGTTICPWMQFYMQSSVIEKGIKIGDYKFALVDVVVGAIATVVVAFFIMVACGATLHVNNVAITEAKDAAMALKPLAGNFASVVFSFGLFIASIFSATILPIATAFFVCEGFGFEAGIDKKLSEAPQFYLLFTSIILISIIIILLPDAPLIDITIAVQVLNGILLPVVLICMIIVINKADIMGEYVNNRTQNAIGIITITVLILLTIILLVYPFVKRVTEFL